MHRRDDCGNAGIVSEASIMKTNVHLRDDAPKIKVSPVSRTDL